ncbi:MAG: aldehyde dehydrogenase family protein [Pseudomonadota bacterium]
MENHKLLIGGALVEGAGTASVINPATEAAFATVAWASAAQARQAVAAARAAFPAWAATPIAERRAKICAIADALEARTADFARTLSQEQGKPLHEATAEIGYACIFLRSLAALDLPADIVQDDDTVRVEVHRKPLGVVAAIIPWNFPILIIAFKLPCALLAGNSVVIKPAPTTPVTSLMLGALIRDILPAGVVNIIAGDNAIGAELTSHPDVAKVSFTGSSETGKKVMASAASTLKRLTLELGGNDAGIVLPDVDVKQTAEKIFDAAFMNCGQVCLALKRAYVHSDIYDAMCDALGKLAQDAVVDDGLKQGTRIGPLQNKMQYEKVKALMAEAKATGTIVAGGEVESRPGYFIRPTIVRDVSDGDRIVDEEQFGPILPVIRFSEIDDVVARANASPYGLGASVWSADTAKAKAIAQRIESGTVWVNQHLHFGPHIPFGGAKQSGFGVEFARQGLEEFTQVQVINMAK